MKVRRKGSSMPRPALSGLCNFPSRCQQSHDTVVDISEGQRSARETWAVPEPCPNSQNRPRKAGARGPRNTYMANKKKKGPEQLIGKPAIRFDGLIQTRDLMMMF